jgi:cobalamin biosynthesis Mg chelatase CobN
MNDNNKFTGLAIGFAFVYVAVFVVLIILFFSSCKTTRQSTRENTHASSVTALDALSATDEKNSREIREMRTDCTSADISVDETVTSIEWSMPDSSGTQYPLRTVTSQKHTGSNMENRSAIKRNTNAQKEKSSVTDSTIRQKSDSKSETDEKKEVKSRTPEWIIVGVLACVLALTGIVYLILKRFGIVK